MAVARVGWLVGLLSCMALLGIPAGASAAAPLYLGSFGPDGTSATDFERTASVAVDQETGHVYVLDNEAGTLYKFDSKGKPVDFEGSAPYLSGNALTGLNLLASRGKNQVAVSPVSHAIYVTTETGLLAFQPDGEPSEFTAGPGEGTNELAGEVIGIAVDLNGTIYASESASGVKIFTASGELINEIVITEPANLAVATDGSLYVNRLGSTVLKYAPSEFPVTSTTTYAPAAEPVDPRNTKSVAVDPVNGDVYLMQLYPTDFRFSQVVVYDASGVFKEAIGEPGTEGELGDASTGVAVRGAIGGSKIYVASDDSLGGEESQVKMFGPEEIVVGPPTIFSTAISDVTSTTADLHASINPNTASTTYRFEYGLSDCSLNVCAEIPIGGEAIGDGHTPVAVVQHVSGLQPDTTYHVRVVAENGFDATASTDRTFRTQSAGLEFALIDARVWEMVSPSNKHGGSLRGSGEGLIQAAADGESLAYLSLGAVQANPAGSRSLEFSSLLSRRRTAGWESEDITPSNVRVLPWAIGQMAEYKLFTPDLSHSLLEPRDGTQLSPYASERTPYLRANTVPPIYTPLVSGREGFANVPPGTVFGGSESSVVSSVRVAGATEDLSHVALSSVVPLVSGAPGGSAPTLYVWAAGQLQPVSVLPAAEGGEIVSLAVIGSGTGSVRHAIAEDGSRVFWSRGVYDRSDNSLTALYMRDTVAEETVRLDVPQPGASGAGSANPAFVDASVDGSVVYFTDSRRLTEDANPGGRDLYRCEIPLHEPVSGCSTLTDVSVALEPEEDTDVLGLAPALSRDGTSIYFVAEGVLDASPNQQGDSATAGQPNLYVWQQGSGARYIATLSEQDDSNWGERIGFTFAMGAAGSPNGRYLAFMSNRSLTGYDNREAVTGTEVQEAFQYDAASDQLYCISCKPTNGTPEADDRGDILRPLVDPRRQIRGHVVSAVLPQPAIVSADGISLYQPRAVLDSGRVFFNSIDALVASDGNEEWDVYQHEPSGVGSCTSASGGQGTAVTDSGCVSLISSGTGEEEAGFLDASVTGDDVFFLTPARLSVDDEDAELDVYDARVNGKAAVRIPVSECGGETCRTPGAPPSDAAPNSATFTGPGNVKSGKRCPKGKKKVKRGGKTRCVKKKGHKQKQGSGKGGRSR